MQRRLEDQIIGTIDNKEKKRDSKKKIHIKQRNPHRTKVKTQVANY